MTSQRFASATVVTAMATMMGVVGLASSAEAAAKPLAALKVSTNQVDAGSTFSARYSLGHVPLHSTVVLQRTYGTARVYKTIKTLVVKTTSAKYAGSVTTVAPAMGSYGYRVLVVSSKHRAVVAAGTTIHSFANVPLSAILGTTTLTVQIGDTLFRYAATAHYEGTLFLHFDKTTCRRADLVLAADAYSQGGVFQVIQETADPFTGDIPAGSVVPFTVPLSGGAADFHMTPNHPNGNDTGRTYVNGTLNCWTSTGTIATNNG